MKLGHGKQAVSHRLEKHIYLICFKLTIIEALRTLMFLFPWKIPSLPYRAGFGFENPADDIHGFPYVATGTEELMACLECLRDIDAVHVFAALLFEHRLIHDFHAEVVQDHSAPDFLDDKFALAGPELFCSQGMLQVAEGGLDAPAEAIDFLQGQKRELCAAQVCCQIFVHALFDFDTDDANRERNLPAFSVLEEIKLGGGGNDAIVVKAVLMQVFGFPMMADKMARHGHVKRLAGFSEPFLSQQASCT